MLPCAAFSRALGRSARSTRLPLRKLHSGAPQVPFSLSHWSEPTGNSLVPIVIEQTVCGAHRLSLLASLPVDSPRAQGRGERSYDIFSRLLRERVIMLYGPVCQRINSFMLNSTFPANPRFFFSDSGHRRRAHRCAASLPRSRRDIETYPPVYQFARRQCHCWFGHI